MRVLTPEQVAEILQLSIRKIYAMLKSGELPAKKIGSQWRILESELEEYMRDKSKKDGDDDADMDGSAYIWLS